MSRHRINPRSGSVNMKKLPKGPNGRALCRRCGAEVPVGRRTFCSAACVDEWKLTTSPQFVRQKVWERDHGVCALCHVDTVALTNDIAARFADVPGWARYGREQRSGESPERRRRYFELERELRHHGISMTRWFDRRSSYGIWDADHIVPVVEGGGECGLENYRTLCLRCHRRETAALRRRLRGKNDVVNHTLFEE